MLKRSMTAKDVGLSEEETNVIENTLLKYKPKSQYFLQLPSKDYLNVIAYLLLYKPSMSTKKTKGVLSKLSNSEQQQLKDTYFDKPKQQKYMNIAQLAEITSQSFHYYEQLIKKSMPFFQELSINYLFEHEEYRNKIRISQFLEDSLRPLDKLNQPKVQFKNDLILIENDNGYFLACYSAQIYYVEKGRSQKSEIMQVEKGSQKGEREASRSSGQKQRREEEQVSNGQEGQGGQGGQGGQEIQQKLSANKPGQEESPQVEDGSQSSQLQKETSFVLLIIMLFLGVHFLIY